MNRQLTWLLIFLTLLLALILAAEALHKKWGWPPERSRKFLHVTGGIMCLFFPVLFSSHWWVLLLATVAFTMLLITYNKKLLPSVHQTRRYSVGSVLFPVPVYVCFLLAQTEHNGLFFYLPVALLAFADTAAEAGGNRWGHRGPSFFNGQKTLAGSLSYLVTAAVVCVILLLFIYHLPTDQALLITSLTVLLTTIAELVTLHGWDNLTIPLVSAGILYVIL